MYRTHIMLIGISALALGYGGAAAQTAPPDQPEMTPGSNPNMGEGAGAGPGGSIGDPNGNGPGSAAPAPGPIIVDRPKASEKPLSTKDKATLTACLAMPHEAIATVAKCRTLMKIRPDLFN